MGGFDVLRKFYESTVPYLCSGDPPSSPPIQSPHEPRHDASAPDEADDRTKHEDADNDHNDGGQCDEDKEREQCSEDRRPEKAREE